MSNNGSCKLFLPNAMQAVGQGAGVGQHRDMSRPRPAQLFRARRHRGAGGHHIIHKHDRAALHIGLAGHLEGTGDIGGALPAGQALGAGGRLAAHQRIDQQRPARLAGDMAGNFGGLVEAALPQAEGVRWHRHDHGIIGQRAGHAQHGARHQAGKMQAPAMFQRQHHCPRRTAIGQGRAGTGKGRRFGETGAALRRRIAIVRQGHAAAGALRRPQKLQGGKAGGAKPVITVDDAAAAGTARRQHRVDDGAQRQAEQVDGMTGHAAQLARAAAGRKGKAMSELPFDPVLRRHRHARAAAGFAGVAFLHDRMAEDLRDRAAMIARPFADVLDLGGPRPVWPTGDGVVRAALAAESGARVVVADEDRLPFGDASFDLVVAAGSLATVNDLPGTLAGVRRVLRPDGLFMASFVGGMSLIELRSCLIEAEAELTSSAGRHTAPMVEAAQAAGLLARAGLVMPVADVDRITLRYASLFGLLDDLAAMGARSVLAARRPLRRDVLMNAAARFAALADPDGKTGVTIEILHVAGWAPGPGQPSPKARGSATTSLAAALKSQV